MFYLHKVAPDDVELQLHPRHNPENPHARGVCHPHPVQAKQNRR
jgi:hypothetical protein